MNGLGPSRDGATGGAVEDVPADRAGDRVTGLSGRGEENAEPDPA